MEENDTTANEDIAMISSMSIREKRRRTMRKRQKGTDCGGTGGIDLVTSGHRATDMPGLQAEETLAMRNGPQMSIHQLLVLLDHLYL